MICPNPKCNSDRLTSKYEENRIVYHCAACQYENIIEFAKVCKNISIEIDKNDPNK